MSSTSAETLSRVEAHVREKSRFTKIPNFWLGSKAKVIAASSDLQSNSARAHAPRQSLKPPRSYKMPRGKKKADPEPEPDENELMEDAPLEDDDEESAVSVS
mmetsp:Transcript_1402/g.6266  ORF Transcript_1402/g.6266 Transcript_1402/m.6266 type:complete len:102 (+) Transcript_1402:888-1193(+)